MCSSDLGDECAFSSRIMMLVITLVSDEPGSMRCNNSPD